MIDGNKRREDHHLFSKPHEFLGQQLRVTPKIKTARIGHRQPPRCLRVIIYLRDPLETPFHGVVALWSPPAGFKTMRIHPEHRAFPILSDVHRVRLQRVLLRVDATNQARISRSLCQLFNLVIEQPIPPTFMRPHLTKG